MLAFDLVDHIKSELTEQFLEGFNDENDSNQSGEGLLSEPGEVSDDGGQVESHDDETEQGGPESYPESHGEVVDFIVFTEVDQDLLEDEDGAGAAEDGERLASEHAEHPARYEVTQEGLQHALAALSDVAEKTSEGDGLGDGRQVDVDDGGQRLEVKGETAELWAAS